MVQQVRTTTSIQQQQEFVPPYPSTIAETGLKEGFLEELVLKDIYMVNFALGREIAARTMLPFKIIEEILEVLKKQLLIEVRTSGGLADYEYTPTEKGRDRARAYFDHNSYVGACPVPWSRYIDSLRSDDPTRVGYTKRP